LVMAAMWSVRTLLWSVDANWGDTGSNPLPSVVALGSITVIGAIGAVVGAVVGRVVSVSSRTLTKLLMVSRILSTFTGVRAWDETSFGVASLEA
jgi:hypothetical protein